MDTSAIKRNLKYYERVNMMFNYVAVFKEDDNKRIFKFSANDRDEAYERAESNQKDDEVLLFLVTDAMFEATFELGM